MKRIDDILNNKKLSCGGKSLVRNRMPREYVFHAA
jgi:hypothetical protein